MLLLLLLPIADVMPLLWLRALVIAVVQLVVAPSLANVYELVVVTVAVIHRAMVVAETVLAV